MAVSITRVGTLVEGEGTRCEVTMGGQGAWHSRVSSRPLWRHAVLFDEGERGVGDAWVSAHCGVVDGLAYREE